MERRAAEEERAAHRVRRRVSLVVPSAEALDDDVSARERDFGVAEVRERIGVEPRALLVDEVDVTVEIGAFVLGPVAPPRARQHRHAVDEAHVVFEERLLAPGEVRAACARQHGIASPLHEADGLVERGALDGTEEGDGVREQFGFSVGEADLALSPTDAGIAVVAHLPRVEGIRPVGDLDVALEQDLAAVEELRGPARAEVRRVLNEVDPANERPHALAVHDGARHRIGVDDRHDARLGLLRPRRRGEQKKKSQSG